MNGKIKKYLSYRGFGFIKIADSEEEVFFHISNYPRNSIPTRGQDVEFNVIETPKGKEATKIHLVHKTPEIIESEDNETQVAEMNESKGVSDLENLSGIGPKYQQLLQAAGVTSTEKLAEEDPGSLLDKITRANEDKEIAKRLPRVENIEAWINLVKN